MSPFCSPLSDLLLLLVRLALPQSSLCHAIVPQTLRLLDPASPLGCEGQGAAEELLRGMIELCSSAPVQLSQPPPLPGKEAPPGDEVMWRDNTLTRQIAGAKTVGQLLDWMLMGTEESKARQNGPSPDSVTRPPTPEAITSSLIASASLLTDLIRKNNSDFIEQQILAWAKRKELAEAHRQERVDLELEPALLQDPDTDRGPCLLDLSPLLTVIAGRLAGLSELILKPRSLVSRFRAASHKEGRHTDASGASRADVFRPV